MGVPLRVLFIEDSEDDTALLVRELKRAGYETDYKRVDTPNSLKAVLAAGEWDLVISDFSMPLFSGTDALKLVRDDGIGRAVHFRLRDDGGGNRRRRPERRSAGLPD